FIGTSSNGMNGLVQVEVTVENRKMTAIKVTQQSETEGIGTVAFAPLIEQALEKQSANVDTIGGATITSEAFKEALQNALYKAGI
ncbi:MAG: FMN-binding protein, partial [Clostridia bacterium]|nr:FMN-binding protein [Clostridia bacterium]